MSKVLPSSQTDGSEFDAASSSQGVPSAEFDGTVLRGRIIGGDQSSHHTHPASDIVSGTMATARLGSGSASTTTFLRGDSTWATGGVDGKTWTSDSNVPSSGTGVDGDFHFEDDTHKIYKKISGTWTEIADISGGGGGGSGHTIQNEGSA